MKLCNDSDKIMEIATWFLDNKATVRKTGKHFNISKTTVHNILDKYLPRYYCEMEFYRKVRAQLDHNANIRHIRGGTAYAEKWRKLRKPLEEQTRIRNI